MQAYAYLKNKRAVVSIPSSNWAIRPHWRRLGKWYREIRRRRGKSEEATLREEDALMGAIDPGIERDLGVVEASVSEALRSMGDTGAEVGEIIDVKGEEMEEGAARK